MSKVGVDQQAGVLGWPGDRSPLIQQRVLPPQQLPLPGGLRPPHRGRSRKREDGAGSRTQWLRKEVLCSGMPT